MLWLWSLFRIAKFTPFVKAGFSRSARKMRKSRAMKTKPKNYSGAFKAKIGLAALVGIKTTAQIGRENQVHPLLVGQWKMIVRERLPELFEPGHHSERAYRSSDKKKIDHLVEAQMAFRSRNRTLLREGWAALAETAHYDANELARLCQLSTRQLQRQFRHHLERSPQDWLNERRMLAARELLRSGLRIKEITFLLGFKQASHFCRQFKLLNDMSPSEFAGSRFPSKCR